MKRLVVILVAVLGLAVGAGAHAQTRRHPTVRASRHERAGKARAVRHRGRLHIRRTSAPALRSTYDDELALPSPLVRQLQHNLADAGYYDGAFDGHVTARTRRALADFQRDYHLRPDGHLDRTTANALLGRDAVTRAAPPPSS